MTPYATHLQDCYLRARLAGFDAFADAIGQMLSREVRRTTPRKTYGVIRRADVDLALTAHIETPKQNKP